MNNYDRHHQHHDNNKQPGQELMDRQQYRHEQPGQKVMDRQQYRHGNEQPGQKAMERQQYRHDNEQPGQKMMEIQGTISTDTNTNITMNEQNGREVMEI